MKILFVLENYLPHIGGVEVVFMNLAEGLAKLGHDVSIVTHRLKKTKKFEIIRGVKVYRVDCFHSRYAFTFLSIPKVLELAKRADIIHTTTFNGAPPAWLAAKFLRKKSIITIHEVWMNNWRKYTNFSWLKSLLHDFLERLIYFLPFDRYVAVSKSTQKQLHKIHISPKKTRVIYNGIDYSHFNPKKYSQNKMKNKLELEKNFVCLITGRAGPSKGIEHAVRAFPEVLENIPNAKLLLILSKNKQYQKANHKLKNLIRESNISNKVIFHDPIPWSEIPEFVKAADCVIVPSLAEGFGFTAAEACAMGKPVVASNTTSLPEVVSGKYVLIEPKNSDAIARGVVAIHENKAVNSKLKRFTVESNIQNYLEVYEKLI